MAHTFSKRPFLIELLDKRIQQVSKLGFFALVFYLVMILGWSTSATAQSSLTCSINTSVNYTTQNPLPFLGSLSLSWTSTGANSVRLYGIGKNGTTEGVVGQKYAQNLMYDQIYTVIAQGSGENSPPCTVKVPVNMPAYLKILGTGQSNMRGYLATLNPLNSALGGFPRGKDYFEDRMTQESSVVTQSSEFLPEFAIGGSALLKENDTNLTCPDPTDSPRCRYWVDYSGANPTRGVLLDRAIAKLNLERQTTKPVNFILWAQGEQDAQQIEKRAVLSGNFKGEFEGDLSRYKTALKFLITELRAASGSIRTPLGIQALGRRVQNNDSNSHLYGISRIQEIQKDVANEMFGVEILADTYDAPLYDTVHMNRDGQELVLNRIIENVALFLNREDTLLGPQIESATIELGQNSLVLDVSNATSLNKGAAVERLFTLLKYDQRMTPLLGPTSIEVINSEKIRLNFNYDLTVDLELGVAYGAIVDVGTTNSDLYQNGWYLANENDLPVRPSLMPLKANGEVSAINPAGDYGNQFLEGHVQVLENSFKPIARNELFDINGKIYEVNNASSVGNLYLGDQVITDLNIGDLIVRQNKVAPPNESYINKFDIYAPSNLPFVQTAKSNSGHKNIAKNELFDINGRTYEVDTGSSIGNLYLGEQVITGLNLGDKVVRQNKVAPSNESYINRIEIYAPSNRLAIQTAKSTTSQKIIVFGQQIMINGKSYTTLSGSGVGSIYLDRSLIHDFSLGDKVSY